MAIIAAWNLNGNSNDNSGNGFNGTDTNVTYSSVYTKNGLAAQMTGTGRIVFTSSPSLTPLVFTFMSWDNQNSFSGNYAAVCGCQSSGGIAIKVQNSSSGGQTGNISVDSSLVVNVGSAIKVPMITRRIGSSLTTFSYDGNTGAGACYINGELIGTFTKKVTFSQVQQNLGNNAGYNQLDGAIDSVRLHDVVLSAAQIKNQYLLGTGFF